MESGGKVVKVIVPISYSKGAVVCHQYDKLDGAHFAKFVQDNSKNMCEQKWVTIVCTGQLSCSN